ncbi:MAG: hypothetical protein RIS24_3493, partial [Verrucomicrobiota bacterium]
MTLPELSDALSVRVAELCAQLLPAGRQVGSQWIVGNVFGDAGDSLYVELTGPKQGLWYDHAAGNGGDLPALLGQPQTLPKGRAAQWAREFLGIRDDYQPEPRRFDPLKHGHRADASQPYRYGSAAWPYPDADGTIQAYVVRFDLPDGSKDVRPLRFLPPENQPPDLLNPRHWRWKGWTSPESVPLFNLHLLARRPNDPVLVVEGEKTAVAASKLFPSHVVITWQGGSKRVARAAIDPLLTRATPIVLWPDADKPGRDAMVYLKARLPSAKLVHLPDTLPEGWDLADPIPPDVSIQGLLDAAGDLPRPVPAAPLPASPNPLDDLHYDPNSGQWWTRNAWGDYAQINGERRLPHQGPNRRLRRRSRTPAPHPGHPDPLRRFRRRPPSRPVRQGPRHRIRRTPASRPRRLCPHPDLPLQPPRPERRPVLAPHLLARAPQAGRPDRHLESIAGPRAGRPRRVRQVLRAGPGH